MNILQKDQIQFIENYLENSNIRYADIRMEMTDHVASAIEMRIRSGDNRAFYDIFKDYMVEHKSTLLKNNKAFIKSADKTILKQFGNRLIRPTSIVFSAIMFIVFRKLLHNIDPETLRSLIYALPILSIVPFCIVYLLTIKWFKLSRFSGIERLGFVYVMVFQLYNLVISLLRIHLRNPEDVFILALSFALVLTISLSMVFLTIKTVNQYRLEYKNLT